MTRSQAISRFFQYFDQDGINYVIMGDIRGYPEEVYGDIDIVIDPHSLASAQQSLLRFCNDHSFKIVQVLQHEQSAWYYVLAWFDKMGKLITFNPDICTDYFRFGTLFLRAGEVLTGRVRTRGEKNRFVEVFAPSPAKGFIYYLLKKIDKGDLDKRHGDYLSWQWNRDAEGGMAEIKRFWPSLEVGMLTKAASTNDWAPIRDQLPRFQSLFNKSLSFSVTHWHHENFRKLWRLYQPTGLFIVFLGSDGSGKSTIISHVQRNLAPLFRRTGVYHLRPHFGRKVKDDTPVPHPHGQTPRNSLSSCLKLLLYLADYCLGYCFIIWPRKVRSTLILFDRYFFDVVIDPKRLRYGGPQWIARLLAKCIPLPDLVIHLDAPTAVLLSRKQELSPSEIDRQRQAYLCLTQNLRGAHTVDASRPLPEVIADVERTIVDFMEARTMKRIAFGG